VTQTVPQSLLFVGLGNPGLQYALTRHNLGFLVVEGFAKDMGLSLKADRRFNARVAKGIEENIAIHLLLPMTYMNLCGVAVGRYIDYFKVPLNHVMIVTDDISLAFGKLRLRSMGSAGGHNGLRSVEAHLGTSHYMRLRMGIGHPGEQMLANYVLEAFSQTEQQELPAFIDRGVEVLKRLLKESFSRVMNSVNTELTKPPLPGRGE
jgi:peptidyl-tRNA hydrolase, PTH1 family